jgi:outer membrane receptor protein involved in Fe transport
VPWCLVAFSILASTPVARGEESGHSTSVPPTAAIAVYSDTLIVRSQALSGPVNPSVAGLVTRINLAEEPGFRDAADLLGAAAGFQVRRYGAVGASAVPSLRGSAAAQIRFYLDGMPLNDAQTGVAGLGRIPLDRISAIEIHRGVVPTELGGIGGSGAVNFISRQDEEGLDGLVRAGSFGEFGGRAAVGLANAEGTLSGSVMIHGLRADNDYSYLDHNQTFYNADDDTVRTRENAWVREWGGWAAGTVETGRLVSRASLGHDRRDGGRPGPLGNLSPHASVRYERTDGQLHFDLDEGLLQVRLAGGRNEEFLHDPRAEVGFGPPGTDRSLSHDIDSRLVWSPVLAQGVLSLQTGFEGRGQWQKDWIVGKEEPCRNRSTVSAFAAATLSVAGNRLQVMPAWRWQRTRDDFPPVPVFPWLPETEAVVNRRDDVSPSLGAVWTIHPERFFLESHATRTVRQPTWVELFGHRGGIDGNRELQPEEITSVDAAVSYRSGQGGFSGRLAAFLAETEDKIVFIQNSQRTSKAINAGRTLTRGIELELRAMLPDRFSLAGNLTLQRAEDRGGKDPTYEGNKLPFLPDTEARVRLKRPVAKWTPWLEVAHMGSNYRDRANTELNKAPERTLLNLGVARDWNPKWLGTAGVVSVLAEVVNLTDNAVYDVEGFPLPGRSWHLAVHLRR